MVENPLRKTLVGAEKGFYPKNPDAVQFVPLPELVPVPGIHYAGWMAGIAGYHGHLMPLPDPSLGVFVRP